MVIIKTTNKKHWQGYGEKGALVYSGGIVNWCECCGEKYRGASKIKNRTAI